MNTHERTARCGCGKLTVTTTGEPADVYACSCLGCQRNSGSAFSYGAIFPESSVSITGDRKTWRRTSDSGRWTESVFCPVCGGNVCFRAEAWPGIVGVSAGCFADPDFPAPKRLYWASRRHHWLDIPDGIEVIETQPGA
jgi:hypothetical protein